MTTGFQAKDRALLRVSGSDAEKFLQDLLSNDVTGEGLTYAALLTPQGKFMADFLVHRDADGFVLEVKASSLPSIAARLSMYKLRADVQIEPDEREVWVITDGEVGFADPRLPDLGRRHYGPLDAVNEVEPHAWEAARIANLVPAEGAELVANESYILECGFERLNGVDFRKGCYVGQEVTARMKHKTELRKGLSGVAFSRSGVAPGAEILRDGKVVGTVTSVSGTQGIAYIRFDRAGPGMLADDIDVTLRVAP